MILIIDGNYMLNRMVYSLVKYSRLSDLYAELESSLKSWQSKFKWKHLFITVDGKNAWRKALYRDYKAHRSKKDDDINWTWVFETFDLFVNSAKDIKILRNDTIEGDDWIAYAVNYYNKQSEDCVIISGDYDLFQLLRINHSYNTFNIMLKDLGQKDILCMPEGLDIFLNTQYKDFFEQVENSEKQNFIHNLMFTINEKKWINADKELFVKIITGDRSDNIPSVYQVKQKTRTVGIGNITAEKMWELSNKEDIKEDLLPEEILELVCIEKNIQTPSEKIKILENINRNIQLISLNKIPDTIQNTILTELPT